jgi:hypothetical protein
MPCKVNVSFPDADVPMMAILDGAQGSPFESTAQMATRSLAFAGNDPPVVDFEIVPIPGASAGHLGVGQLFVGHYTSGTEQE